MRRTRVVFASLLTLLLATCARTPPQPATTPNPAAKQTTAAATTAATTPTDTPFAVKSCEQVSELKFTFSWSENSCLIWRDSQLAVRLSIEYTSPPYAYLELIRMTTQQEIALLDAKNWPPDLKSIELQHSNQAQELSVLLTASKLLDDYEYRGTRKSSDISVRFSNKMQKGYKPVDDSSCAFTADGAITIQHGRYDVGKSRRGEYFVGNNRYSPYLWYGVDLKKNELQFSSSVYDYNNTEVEPMVHERYSIPAVGQSVMVEDENYKASIKATNCGGGVIGFRHNV